MSDLISRAEVVGHFQRLKEASETSGQYNEGFVDGLDFCISFISTLPSEERWHVIKKRPMTNDERIEWSERIGYDIEDEDAFIYSDLPDDGEEVLVSSQYGLVYVDTFCQDEGCYFEENGDMDGIVAWMEKPKPYRGDKK